MMELRKALDREFSELVPRADWRSAAIDRALASQSPPPTDDVRALALEEAALLAETRYADGGWNPLYKQAGASIACAIRALSAQPPPPTSAVRSRITHFWPLPWSSTRPDDERMVDVLDAQGRSIAHMEWPFHSTEETDEAEQITYALADLFAAVLSVKPPLPTDAWIAGEEDCDGNPLITIRVDEYEALKSAQPPPSIRGEVAFSRFVRFVLEDDPAKADGKHLVLEEVSWVDHDWPDGLRLDFDAKGRLILTTPSSPEGWALDRVAAALARAEEELPRLAAPDGTVAIRIEDLREVLNTHSSGWQDISTAPDEGEYLAGWDENGREHRAVCETRKAVAGNPLYVSPYGGYLIPATRWMPLPSSPSGET